MFTLFGPTKGTPVLAANQRARWALTCTLSQYDYTIEYRKTADHGNADALSHLPEGQDLKFDEEEQGAGVSTVCTIKVISLQLDTLEPGLLAKECRKDPIMSVIMR